MSIHYKFKNLKDYNSIKFDGVWMSAADLKSTIVQQQKLGNSEVQLENEETKQIYSDDQQIPKNTNIIVIRLPPNSNKRTRLQASQPYPARFSASSSGATASGNINQHHNNHHHNSNNHHNHYNSHGHHNNHHHGAGHHHNRHHMSNRSSNHLNSASSSSATSSTANGGLGDAGGAREAMELVSSKNKTEEEKLKHIQSQSTEGFEPSFYARGGGRGGGGRGGGPGGYRQVPGPGYICKKCGISGHLIYDCKQSSAMYKVKRSSGIPRDFLMKVDSKEKGALMTPSGEYAVPYIDREAYNNPKVEKAPFFEEIN